MAAALARGALRLGLWLSAVASFCFFLAYILWSVTSSASNSLNTWGAVYYQYAARWGLSQEVLPGPWAQNLLFAQLAVLLSALLTLAYSSVGKGDGSASLNAAAAKVRRVPCSAAAPARTLCCRFCRRSFGTYGHEEAGHSSLFSLQRLRRHLHSSPATSCAPAGPAPAGLSAAAARGVGLVVQRAQRAGCSLPLLLRVLQRLVHLVEV